MTQLDEKLISEARSIRVSPQYIEAHLIPYAESEECLRILKEEEERAWIARERSAFDTL